MPRILKIITNPNNILRKKSIEITEKKISSSEMNGLILNMVKTMLAKDGIGIAAPQVGKNMRIIAINTKEGVVSMINPKITTKSITKEWGEEGCLSVPNIFGQVRRHKKVTCQFRDISGREAVMKAEGLMARVVQHEIDHLDGILFIDKARDLKEVEPEYRSKRD